VGGHRHPPSLPGHPALPEPRAGRTWGLLLAAKLNPEPSLAPQPAPDWGLLARYWQSWGASSERSRVERPARSCGLLRPSGQRPRGARLSRAVSRERLPGRGGHGDASRGRETPGESDRNPRLSGSTSRPAKASNAVGGREAPAAAAAAAEDVPSPGGAASSPRRGAKTPRWPADRTPLPAAKRCFIKQPPTSRFCAEQAQLVKDYEMQRQERRHPPPNPPLPRRLPKQGRGGRDGSGTGRWGAGGRAAPRFRSARGEPGSVGFPLWRRARRCPLLSLTPSFSPEKGRSQMQAGSILQPVLIMPSKPPRPRLRDPSLPTIWERS